MTEKENDMELRSFDGKKIYVHEWLDVENPKGVVQIVHGMAEHAARYESYARYLNEHGYIVVADDHRGHGKTDYDSLGYAKGDMFANTVRDEAGITDYYQKKYAGLSYFLFGFSYGSFLTQSYIGKYGDKLDGVIIAGSNYKKDFEVYLGAVVASLKCLIGGAKKPAKLLEKLSFGAYAKHFEDGQWLSTDDENNAKYAEDPLCGFTCSYRFYKDFFKGLRSLYTRSYCEKLRTDLPVLVVSGKEDAVGDMGEGVKKLVQFYREKIGMKDAELVLFENSRHEFLNEKTDAKHKWETPLKFFDKICAEKE